MEHKKTYVHFLNGNAFNQLLEAKPVSSSPKFDIFEIFIENSTATEDVKLFLPNGTRINFLHFCLLNFLSSSWQEGVKTVPVSTISKELFGSISAKAEATQTIIDSVDFLTRCFATFSCEWKKGKGSDFIDPNGEKLLSAQIDKKMNNNGSTSFVVRMTSEPVFLTYCKGFGNRIISIETSKIPAVPCNYFEVRNHILKTVLACRNSKSKLFPGVSEEKVLSLYRGEAPVTKQGKYKFNRHIEKIFEGCKEKGLISDFSKVQNRAGKTVYHFTYQKEGKEVEK